MTNVKEMICIRCPQGCHLAVENDAASGQCQVTGNRCPRGAEYARQELLNPCRVVTASVRTNCLEQPYLPVRTNGALPKRHIDALLNRLYAMTIELPIARGEIIIENVNGTGINVVASQSVREMPK